MTQQISEVKQYGIMLRIALDLDGWLAFWLASWSLLLYIISIFIQGISEVRADLEGVAAGESFWSEVFFRAGITLGICAIVLPFHNLLPRKKRS